MLADALTAAFVLAVLFMSMGGLYTAARRSEETARNQTIANQMAQRFIEQLQLMRASDMNAQALIGVNLIDPGQANSPFSFTNIPLDAGTGHSPAQALRQGTGTLTLTTVSTNAVRADVTITWRTRSGQQQSITTGTIVGGYR